MRSYTRTVGAGLVLALTLAACGSDKKADSPAATVPVPNAAETTTTAAATQPGTIVDVAVGAGSFTTLVAAVKAAGLVDTLSGPGPFTVFAPTDDAFAKALKELGITADQLLADKEKLTAILKYHVVSGKVLAADVLKLDGKSVATLNGAEVKVTINGSTVKINDATVTTPDVMASNGVIHVIDTVLLPPAG